MNTRHIPGRGYTLIELMVVLVIIAILSSLAYPSYRSYVRRGARAEAKVGLLESQQFMERWYAANSTYQTSAGQNPALPARLANLPADQSTVRYQLSVEAAAGSYTLTAAPVGSMAGDDCGNLTLTSTGVRGRSGTAMSVTDCWK